MLPVAATYRGTGCTDAELGSVAHQRGVDDIRARADALRPAASVHSFRRQPASQSGHDEVMIIRAVASARSGDQEAVRYLYLRFANNVYGYVRSIVRDDHEAEDVTQQVFAKLMVSLPRYKSHGTPFSRWILRVAHNAAIDYIRGCRATPFEEVRPPDNHADDALDERGRCLHSALDALPEDQRTVLLLRHVLGLSPDEIADRMGRSTSSVHGLHHRGRRAIRVDLLSMDAGPVTSGALEAVAS
jgi:RNA polymerase sigma-70 factor (ECF subfamily)